MIHFDLPKEKSSIIKVIGMGGGGSNAVNYMHHQGIDGVDFIICNTDAQALAQSKIPNKIQLGPALTQGLGAGANPDIGRLATEESLEEIKRILEVNTKMAFITAGMGGGTGTGGAPIVAKICQDLGILTVGIVTTPFSYEGKKRLQQAEQGINFLKDHVDTLLVISNDKLRHQFGNLTMRAAFNRADNVLATAAKCITDVINSTGQINVDFADVCTVMKNGGVAILGSASANGENRAYAAIEHALNSPLLNDNDIRGARWILININSAEGAHEFTMDEVDIIQQHLLSQAGEDTDVILGLGYDNSLGDSIGITLIATGFEHKNPFEKQEKPQANKADEKIVMVLENKPAAPVMTAPVEEKKEEEKPVEVVADPMAPVMVETQTPPSVSIMPVSNPQVMEITLERTELHLVEEKEIIRFDFSDVTSNLPTPVESTPLTEVSTPTLNFVTTDQDASTAVTSGGYLAKPSNIYAEEPVKVESKKENPVGEPSPLQNTKEETSNFEMQLVIKESNAAEVPGTIPSTLLNSVEETALPDEAEEQKRKAAERLHKLRNLSFNLNTADPNSEYEMVPAYIRRNLQMHQAVSPAEKFYSNYTVKTDENNQTQISTLNTFLDGKKPD